MLKKIVWLAVATLFFAFQVLTPSANAVDLDAESRTVPLNANGDTLTISVPELAQGKKMFQYACAQCHAGGVTKTNPNVGLEPETLALATPPRDNVEELVSFMRAPMSFDGFNDISEEHPALSSKDLFPEMRNLTDDDLQAIAGYILIQPRVVGVKWGGGKIYY
ncbi:cytochrome c-550 [filamentous cyanobacterium LEGE 11480]|uniref:Photosystem II extrinsic protein V n=1 Tax=Romeriopsis navalis LEGE 11480 TaxID=2777977 RepID=A0A928VM79_9CYAN|nr:photosystem II cytochrome c-550 [Romeriopsis navalis]MBE9030900.1 cytochrome c-550 [Romeriopsis navalis LEGE 11480]